MRTTILTSFDAAIADFHDGASLMAFSWGMAGTPQNLLQALIARGSHDLTLIAHHVMPAIIGKSVVPGVVTLFDLAHQVRKLITAWPGTSYIGLVSPMEQRIRAGEIELELQSHGLLTERMRAGGAGIGGFYAQTGLGTLIAEGKETRVIDGKTYLFQLPLTADFAFIRAHRADRLGNLTYRGSARGSNPLMAKAARTVIAEVDEIVEPGELDPETIVTPGIYVDRLIQIPAGALGSAAHRRAALAKLTGNA